MNFQDKAFENAAVLRTRATAIAGAAIAAAKEQATLAAERAARLKGSLHVLKTAGRELRKVTGLHAAKFIAQNSDLARAAGKDVSALAHSTYLRFTRTETAEGRSASAAKTSKPRKSGARKRAGSTARVRRAAKEA